MTRPRNRPDGLPFRVYCYKGTRRVRYYYQHRDRQETISVARRCNEEECKEARRVAVLFGSEMNNGAPTDQSVAAMFDAYFRWQNGLPVDDERRKATTTLTENAREQKKLLAVFGTMRPDEITAQDLYEFQDRRVNAGAGQKCNKEIALLSAIMEFGRRKGLVLINVARGIKRVPTKPKTRRVTWDEIQLLRKIATTPGETILALAAAAAWLCVLRPPEILTMQRSSISVGVVRFIGSKRKAGHVERSVLIEWSPMLREVMTAALEIEWRKVAGSFYVFGNLEGQKYSKSGWGANWRRLQDKCAEKVEGWQTFALMDCRPGGVSSKQERGDTDTQDATMHEDSRMIERIYDRRRERKATPAG